MVALLLLRVDVFIVGIAAELQRARRTGLTFALEAGTWRMRQVINKLIREEDLYGAVESAYSQGWRRMSSSSASTHPPPAVGRGPVLRMLVGGGGQKRGRGTAEFPKF